MIGLPRSLIFLLVAITSSNAAKTLNVTFPANPPANATSSIVQDNFLGISFELSSFDTLWGPTVAQIPNAMQNYLHNLGARITNPLRIRIGGNGMDGSTWMPNMTDKMLVLTDPDAYFNDIPVDFGPVLFDVMNGMYDKVGPMEFIIGLSMRTPEDDLNTVQLATAAYAALGDRLDGLLLGNEPDLYAGHGNRDAYDLATYIPEINSVLDDLEAAGVLEKPLIGGPTICCQWSLDEVIKAGINEKKHYKYYTLQHYPNNNCNGPDEKNTNISYYLSHENIKDYVGWNDEGINLAKSEDVPVLLTEYNSVSCGGSNISNTFATALWAIDAGLKSGAQNFSAVYLHTREWGVTYNLFQPATEDSFDDPDWTTGSTYYAALFLSETFASSGSVIVDLNVDNGNWNPAAKTAAYGIYDNAGAERGNLVLINYAEADGNGGKQGFRIEANMTDAVEYRILTAPSVYETTEITWAGQTVRTNGILDGDQTTETKECSNGCVINVPSPGAALVTIGSSSFYTGNSTIAGYGYASYDNAGVPLGGGRGLASVVLGLFGLLVGVYLF